jgi:glycyl-tRNA synthetase beta chain
VKIIVEHHLPVDIRVLFQTALVGYKGSEAEKRFTQLDKYSESISAFFRERLEFYLRDVRGFAYDEVNAVLAAGSDRVTDVLARAQAVSEVRKSADFEPISVAFKRIKNILRQAREAGKGATGNFESAALQDPAEKQLAEAVEKTAPLVSELRHKHKYTEALAEIAKLRPALDTFFDKVMVMAEDEKLRSNRLLLLEKMLNDFSTIADFSEIVTEKK